MLTLKILQVFLRMSFIKLLQIVSVMAILPTILQDRFMMTVGGQVVHEIIDYIMAETGRGLLIRLRMGT